MNVTIPPTEKEMNIASIRRAADAKRRDVEVAEKKLSELKAELRGLTQALEVLSGTFIKSSDTMDAAGSYLKEG